MRSLSSHVPLEHACNKIKRALLKRVYSEVAVSRRRCSQESEPRLGLPPSLWSYDELVPR